MSHQSYHSQNAPCLKSMLNLSYTSFCLGEVQDRYETQLKDKFRVVDHVSKVSYEYLSQSCNMRKGTTDVIYSCVSELSHHLAVLWPVIVQC